jgi:putative molybdopterin biosynthesis protein
MGWKREKWFWSVCLSLLERITKMFRQLLTLAEAEMVIHRHFKPGPLGFEEVSLLEAFNRILAEDVMSTLDIPPFDRSTVDGYAVKAQDTFGADENRPVHLRVCGTVSAGQKPKKTVTRGTTLEIVTGAPMPKGADAVVMVEYTKREREELHVYAAAARDENVMKAGGDIKNGEIVLNAGQLLGSREIGVLAATGLAKVKVWKIPRVAVLSTGAEVAEPGRRLQSGKVYDINAYTLSTAVLESRGKPIHLGVFPDDRVLLRQALSRALESADAVITSGGVSVGPKDIMPQTVDSLGKPGVIVSGIAIKPGKPTTVALIDGKPVFSLPGHPTSALLVFQLLVSPIIQQMSGRSVQEAQSVEASLTMRVFSAKGRRTFVMVKLKLDKSRRLVAEPVATGVSGAITTLAKADGFVEITEKEQFIDAGEEVTVQLFRNYRT